MINNRKSSWLFSSRPERVAGQSPRTMSDLQIMEDLVASVPQFKTGVGGEREETSDGSNGRSFGSSNLPSPETEEFESLEKSFREELEQKLHERKISEAERKTSDLASGRRLSGLSSKTRKERNVKYLNKTNNSMFTITNGRVRPSDLLIFAVRRTLCLSSWWRRGNSAVSPGRTSICTPWRRTWPSGSTCSTPTSTSTLRTSWTVFRQGNIFSG